MDAWEYLPGSSGDAWDRMCGTSGDAWERLAGSSGDAWERLIEACGEEPSARRLNSDWYVLFRPHRSPVRVF